ncbi:carboxypeptidase-like regulatory domain-containing protein [Nocardioides sp.]|uniref:carboxypeptidase-like regulatory domain-containing protein n=1 Tax=Nocardioides sp. TaxID=35761 RepID=UPI001A1BD961|nr:carboxypeptidase-like regulatory domain-containing protein [Nocardioides sp.]MBJ7356594.1 carboxypeptidase regulatory-like domain-containing protein [Nocardioides sp.]
MSRPRTPARRVLVSLTALAVNGTALTLGAGPASAAPGDPDITGTVVNAASAGIAGVHVWAITTPSDGSAPVYVDHDVTDAAGAYSLTDLDPASLADGSDNAAVLAETEFKLFFRWGPAAPADYHATGYLARGLGGSKSPRAAGSVVVPSGGTAVAPTQALPAAGGVIVQVLGATGAPVTSYGSATLFEPDSADPFTAHVEGGSTSSDDQFYPDGGDPGTDPDAPVDGLVYIRGVEPGKYVVQASGADYNPATDVYVPYVSRFLGGNGTYSDAKPLPVAAGSFTQVTVRLTDKMTALEEPRIIGNSSFGSKLKADPGTWLGGEGGGGLSVRAADTDYTYQWLRGSKPVATGPTYKLTKKDKKAKIRLVVTAYRGDFVGTAVTDPTSKVGEKSRVTAKRLATGKVAVTVEVAKKQLAQALGTPQGKVVLVTKDGVLASKKATLKGGKAVLSPKRKFAGEKLIVLYLGGGPLGSDTGAVKGG